MKKLLWTGLLIAAGFTVALADEGTAPAGEAETAEKERIEPPTADEASTAITMYINERTASVGDFLVTDDINGETLALRVERIHNDVLPLGDDSYAVCVDVRATNAYRYDVDFILKAHKDAAPSVENILVHKENGMERYTWVVKDGMRVRQPVAQPVIDAPVEENIEP